MQMEKIVKWVPLILLAYTAYPTLLVALRWSPHAYICYELYTKHTDLVHGVLGNVASLTGDLAHAITARDP